MDIRTAILKAADKFERYPALFYYYWTGKPNGNKGCLLGWIGEVADVPAALGSYAGKVACDFLGISDDEFQIRCLRIGDEQNLGGWTTDATVAAQVMRFYADKYHPAAKTPDWEALAKPDAGTFATV